MNGQGDTEEVAFEDAPEKTLWCTTTGQVLTSLGGRQAFQVNYDRFLAERAQAKGSRLNQEQIRTELRNILNLPKETKASGAKSLSNKSCNNVTIDEFEYESEPGIRVPGWFVKPSSGPSKFPVVLMVEDGGKDGLFRNWSFIEKVAGAGIAICSIDLRTSGATRPRSPSSGHLFFENAVELAYAVVNLTLGSPIVAQQTLDLLCGVDFLIARRDVDASRIAVFGSGVSGIPCMAGAALDQRISALLLDRTLADFESVVASKDYDLPLSAVAFGILRKMDLPDICASLAPRPVWLVNSVGPTKNPLTLSDLTESYEVAIKAYAHDKQDERFSLRVEPNPADEIALAWMRKVLA
jgi:hypothetical protein